MKELLGTGVALVTPFNSDKSVDFDGLGRLVNFQIENGINYLVVMGTTAEAVTLSTEEKELVKQKIININNGRLPLVLGIGGNNTANVVAEIQSADLENFDAVLSVSPYYNKPSQEGIYQHFKAIAEVSPKPIIVYNVPGRTGSNIAADTVVRLANDFENIVAVKEAAGCMAQAMKIIQHAPKDFRVISGDDMIALPMTLAGGAGVISVIGQGLPKDFAQLIKFGLNGENSKAFELQYKLMDSIDLIFEEGNPVGIKALLNKVGICGFDVRLPLVEATSQLRQKINSFIDNY